jgi:hypothetical protein
MFPSLVNSLSINHLVFGIGGLFSAILVAAKRTKLEFFTTFEHELTHNIWALLFFMKPVGFHVNEDGSGLFQYIPKNSNIFKALLITLSPYFFPTACFLWLPFYIFWAENWHPLYFTFMGIFFGYHIVSSFHETKPYQSDITQFGKIFSYAIILPLYIIFNGAILVFITNGFSGIGELFSINFINSYLS